MKAHKHWSIGALITMIGTFYTGYKDPNQVIGILRVALLYV